MLTNLLRPWVLARLTSGLAVALLALYGAWVAVRVLRHWRVGSTSEGQLALGRRAELAATLVSVALAVSVLDLVQSLLLADRLTESIRGAMCAYGVFDANAYGFRGLATSALVALACALWLVLHRLDLGLRAPVLTRRKFVALIAIAPLLVLDLYVTARWAMGLDMRVVASCCSVGLDDALTSRLGGDGGPRMTSGVLALGGAALALGTALFAMRAPGRASGGAVAVTSVLAAAAAVPATLWVVAPHVYETPDHMCPFCLLHADAWGIGWGLFGALLVALASGLGVGLVEAHRAAAREPAVVDAHSRRLARVSAIAWAIATTLGLAPVIRYAAITGGSSLFG